MAPRKAKPEPRKQPAATTPEARENQMVSLAVNLAEQQMRDGTASSQIITHFLKLASSREELEKKKLEAEIELGRAKIEAMRSAKSIEKLYSNAIKAMREYQSGLVEIEYEPDDD